jgi:hypothetical protein
MLEEFADTLVGTCPHALLACCCHIDAPIGREGAPTKKLGLRWQRSTSEVCRISSVFSGGLRYVPEKALYFTRKLGDLMVTDSLKLCRCHLSNR